MEHLSVSQSATGPADKPATKPTLEEVCTRFDTWRRGKKPGSRIPKCLWTAAVGACGEHPVWQVSRALGVNYSELKRRAAASGAIGVRQSKPTGGFVELSLGLGAHPVLCSIELESAGGSKVKMSFAGKCRDLDPLELAKLFWGRGR